MKIPIDNVIQCRFLGRAPGSLQCAFWRTLQARLDAAQAAMAIGAKTRVTEKFVRHDEIVTPSEIVAIDEVIATMSRQITITVENGLAVLPAVKIHGRNDTNGFKDLKYVTYAKEFSLRVKSAWQRDVILGVLREFAGKYFRYDMGGPGADKRRLPTVGGSPIRGATAIVTEVLH